MLIIIEMKEEFEIIISYEQLGESYAQGHKDNKQQKWAMNH